MTRCAPALRLLVLNVAKPLAFSAALPRVTVPSLKVTVPAGVPKAPLTLAASATVRPKLAGFGAPLIVVLDGSPTPSLNVAVPPR